MHFSLPVPQNQDCFLLGGYSQQVLVTQRIQNFIFFGLQYSNSIFLAASCLLFSQCFKQNIVGSSVSAAEILLSSPQSAVAKPGKRCTYQPFSILWCGTQHSYRISWWQLRFFLAPLLWTVWFWKGYRTILIRSPYRTDVFKSVSYDVVPDGWRENYFKNQLHSLWASQVQWWGLKMKVNLWFI